MVLKITKSIEKVNGEQFFSNRAVEVPQSGGV